MLLPPSPSFVRKMWQPPRVCCLGAVPLLRYRHRRHRILSLNQHPTPENQFSLQVATQNARQAIFANSGLPGLGCEMGAVASVFEAIAKRCPMGGSDVWPLNVNIQRNLVATTRNIFGLDWRYSIDCDMGNHSHLHVTADQSARLRDATIITVPNTATVPPSRTTFQDSSHPGSPQTFQSLGNHHAPIAPKPWPSILAGGPCFPGLTTTCRTEFFSDLPRSSAALAANRCCIP